MKTCFKCKMAQPLNSFYAHPQMKDGRLNKCITCTKNDVSNRYEYLKQDPSYLERQRERGRNKYHRLNYRNKRADPKVKKLAMALYNYRYPEKVIAKIAITRFERKKGHHLHHWSYRMEHVEDVIELPIAVHYLIHRHLSYDQKYKQYRDKSGNLLDTRQKHEAFIQSF